MTDSFQKSNLLLLHRPEIFTLNIETFIFTQDKYKDIAWIYKHKMVWSLNKHQGFFGQFKLLNKQKLNLRQQIFKNLELFNIFFFKFNTTIFKITI